MHLNTCIRNRISGSVAYLMIYCTLTSSLLSLCEVISAFIIGIPSKNHDIFAAPDDDHIKLNGARNEEGIKERKREKKRQQFNMH